MTCTFEAKPPEPFLDAEGFKYSASFLYAPGPGFSHCKHIIQDLETIQSLI
jgi:hypothetical protein